jgi:SAM-dependent methyltransferase
MIYPQGAEERLRTQFGEAVARSTENRYYCASSAICYLVAEPVLQEIDTAPGDGPLTVWDIGAGEGTFLAEAATVTRRPIRPIGFTAARAESAVMDEKIEWVYGDIQRPETWQPQQALQPDSVDVAISGMTFMHLRDPLGALANAVRVLRPGGYLAVDCIPLTFIADTGEEAEAALHSALDHQVNPGKVTPGAIWETEHGLEHYYNVYSLQFRKDANLALDTTTVVLPSDSDLPFSYRSAV